MKICFVTSTLISGGSERVMSLLANQFAADGHEVEIVNLNKHIVFYPIHNRVHLIFAEDELKSRSVIKKALWLRRHVKKSSPDVVIPFMEAVYCLSLFSLIGLHVPVISSERIDPRKSDFIRNQLRRIFLPLTTHLVVQTQDIKCFYPHFIQKKTTVIYNPVSDQVFHLPEVAKEDVVISVGKLDDQKNHSMLIRAFSRIANDFPEWKLVIFGEGPLRDSLELEVERLALQGRVFLPGRNSNVILEMKKAKVFAFSSNYEGMSNAILEAVCVGLPVVTTDVSGANELVNDGGIIVPVGDEKALTSAIRELLSNKQLRTRMGEANRKRGALFDLSMIHGQWEKVIKDIIKEGTKVSANA